MKTLFNIKSTLNRIRVLTTILVVIFVNVQVCAYTGTFTLITSTDDLTTGYYVVVASNSASTNNKAMGSTVTTGRVEAVNVTISDNKIVNPDDAIVYYITKTSGEYIFQNQSTSKYLYQSSTTSGKGMNFQTSSTTTFNDCSYQASSPVGFMFSSSKASNNYFKYNNSSVWFSNYTSGYSTSMTPVRLFKLAESCTSITPSLSYTSTTLTVGGGNSSTPTVSGNTGGGTVTYAISATPSGCATINTSTGVVTPVAAGSATVTATIGAKGSYCEGTATKNFTINAAACSNTVTINKGTATGCSFTLSKSGAQESCSGVSTTVNITPNTGYQVSSVTESGASSAPSITGTGNTRTVTYAANTTGTSTINVTCTKVNYTVTLDRQSGTGGSGSVTATYGDDMPSATMPTREGYNFGGYYDATGGSGTQYYTATGASARTWNKTSNTTLYAKWTVKTYTVTWKVNDTDYTTGAPSSSVNHGSKVETLPTPPSPASYCGDKFVGWTTDENYTHNTSPLFTTASGAPTASGDQTFYAVFADYAD